MLKSISLAHGLLAAIAAAAPVVVESLDKIPHGWKEVRSAAPDNHIKLSIGLQSANLELFERTLYEIADPSNPRYGKHLSREDAKDLLSPRGEASDSVKRWLSEAGIPDHQVRDDGQWIHVRTTVNRAEGLLTARFGVYARGDEHVVRTQQYSVPAEVREHIATIQPTTLFSSTRESRAAKGSMLQETYGHAKRDAQLNVRDGAGSTDGVDLEQCKTVVTPSCIRKLYNLPTTFADPHPNSSLAIVGFNEQAAQYDQLEKFLDEFDPDFVGGNFSVELVNGGENPQGNFSSGEANLDIQYAVPLAYKIPVRYISVGGENHDFKTDLDIFDHNEGFIEPYLEFASYLLNLPDEDLPRVVSISYGVNEQHVPKSYAKQVCNMFGQLGTRGVSVLVAAGNLGPGSSCQSNDGKNTTKFLPEWPSVCPYVTSIGGTEKNSPEVAVYFSSGGFSEYWPRPQWQDDAVKGWLKRDGNEWKGFYNEKGRAFPDISALAWGYQMYRFDEVETSGGTSAATPVVASMIALLNNDRFKKGKSAMGFLNPWLYKIGNLGFTDITEGRSLGCEGTSVWGLPSPLIPNAGFNAVEGWDPVTGLGTPLYDRLRKLSCR